MSRRGVLETARFERREGSCGSPARGLGRGATMSRSRPPRVTPTASGFGNCSPPFSLCLDHKRRGEGWAPAPGSPSAPWTRFGAPRLSRRAPPGLGSHGADQRGARRESSSFAGAALCHVDSSEHTVPLRRSCALRGQHDWRFRARTANPAGVCSESSRSRRHAWLPALFIARR